MPCQFLFSHLSRLVEQESKKADNKRPESSMGRFLDTITVYGGNNPQKANLLFKIEWHETKKPAQSRFVFQKMTINI
jgi:hypothetical protein